MSLFRAPYTPQFLFTWSKVKTEKRTRSNKTSSKIILWWKRLRWTRSCFSDQCCHCDRAKWRVQMSNKRPQTLLWWQRRAERGTCAEDVRTAWKKKNLLWVTPTHRYREYMYCAKWLLMLSVFSLRRQWRTDVRMVPRSHWENAAILTFLLRWP